MCEPVTLTLLTFGAQAAQAVLQYNEADEDAKSQNAGNAETRRQLREKQELDAMDASRARSQQWEQDAAETNQYAMEHRKAYATLDALVGEGAGGNTASRKLTTLGIKEGQDLATLAANSTRARSEISLGESGRAASTNNQIASIRDVRRPSPLGAALQIGGAAVNAKQQYNKLPKKAS